jgi:hypothetical protein
MERDDVEAIQKVRGRRLISVSETWFFLKNKKWNSECSNPIEEEVIGNNITLEKAIKND